MHRAFSFPVTVERSRTKERLEASLAGLCELELRKQRQECLVLGALALVDPLPQDSSREGLGCFSSWGQENLTLRRQLSALHSSPWGLMQALEQQVGEVRIDADDGAQGDTGNGRPSSGFYESSGGQSPTGRLWSTEPSETVSLWAQTSDRPKAVGDTFMNGDLEVPAVRTTLPRSFSAPYPPLEGIAEESAAVDSRQWYCNESTQAWQPQQQSSEDPFTEVDYQQGLRVESYILSLIQRHTLAPRPCQPRTTLSPDPAYCSTSLHKRTLTVSTEPRLPDPHIQPHDLPSNQRNHGWGCDLLEGEEAPSLEEDSYLELPYPQLRPHSLAERLPSPLPSLDPSCGDRALDLCCEPPSPQHYLHPQPPSHHKHDLVSAHYIPGHPVHSPKHYSPEQPKPNQAITSPDHSNHKSRSSKKSNNGRQRTKKSSSKTSQCQSENSLLGQQVLPERRYSTIERYHGRGDLAQNQGQDKGTGQHAGKNSHNGSRRWCSNLELSQDEGETKTFRRPPRKTRHGHPCSLSQPQNYPHQQQQLAQHWNPAFQERAPLCQGEEGYVGAAPAESESSVSEVYSPASSSLSSDSDENGVLVWPQQLPPRLASTSSSSSPSSQATANTSVHPKAFVKIKASHALKKKILRFRSGSLKVMTTV
ncbi:dapper homolog 3 [Cheilinus undulatus]|uniref:dapper homolog 3 n=1 Tax=Cheilinus undulatus TaxID=241271 RepID=UPI001BD56F2E|nr:dapper homolog 3 [Cheilinus undulatus]